MQVADLVAYEVRQFHHNHLNRPGDDPRWGYVRLVEMVLRSCKFAPLPWFWNFGEEALAELEKSVEQSSVDDGGEVTSTNDRLRSRLNYS